MAIVRVIVGKGRDGRYIAAIPSVANCFVEAETADAAIDQVKSLRSDLIKIFVEEEDVFHEDDGVSVYGEGMSINEKILREEGMQIVDNKKIEVEY